MDREEWEVVSGTGSPRAGGGPPSADFVTLLAAHTAAEPGALPTLATEAQQAHEEQESSTQQEESSAASAKKSEAVEAAPESGVGGTEGDQCHALASPVPVGLASETGPATAISERFSSLAVVEPSPSPPAADEGQEGPAFLRIVRVDEQEQLQRTVVDFKKRSAVDKAALEACCEELASARQALAAEAQAVQRFRRLALLAGAAAACLGVKLLFGGRGGGKCAGVRSALPGHHAMVPVAPVDASVAQAPITVVTVLPPGAAASLPVPTVHVEALPA